MKSKKATKSSNVDSCSMHEWRIEPEEETFPVPLKHTDVVRQTKIDDDSASENTINDFWTEAKDVNLSQEWTGVIRFQILRTRLPEGYRWIQKSIRPDSIWLDAWTKLSKKHIVNELQSGRKSKTNCNQLAATWESMKFWPTTRITSK